MGVGRDRGNPRVGHCDLGVVGGELEVLLVLLGAVVPAREREDQGVLALDLAELSRNVLVIGQLVIGKGAAGGDVAAHDLLLSMVEEWRHRSLSGSTLSLVKRRRGRQEGAIPMSIHTPVCELLGIEHPIVEAPVADDPRLPAAVSNAGALGSVSLWWADDAGDL